MAWPPTTHQDVQDAVTHLRGGGGVYVDDYAADPTGATDSTAAFIAAVAALPTVTVYQTAGTTGVPGATGSGASTVYPYGTVHLGAGTYRLGSSGDVGNLGPFVSVIGAGHTATTVDYRGSGDAIRAANAIRPTSETFFDLVGMGGRFDGITIAGENSGVGATGLHIGDAEGFVLGPDLYIRNFAGVATAPTLALGTTASTGGTFTADTYYWRLTALIGSTGAQETATSNQVTATVAVNGSQPLTWAAVPGATGYKLYRANSVNAYTLVTTLGKVTSYTDTGTAGTTVAGWPAPLVTAGSVGLLLDNQYSWTENTRGWATILNCQTAVEFYGGGGSTVQNGRTGGDNSFMYNDLSFKLYLFGQQNGVVLDNGATYQGGRLFITANVRGNATATTNALLTITGICPTGHLGAGVYSVIDNTDLNIRAEVNGIGLYPFKPQTIKLGNLTLNGLYATGAMIFNGGAASWTPSNFSLAASYANGNMTFTGRVVGDANLAPADGNNVIGPLFYGLTTLFTDGGLPMQTGDFAPPAVLTQNITVNFQHTPPGPQKKTIVVKQSASGGPFTVTWPSNASPTVAAPAVQWAGGVAPAMSTAANAVDVYELVTGDGATWYGVARQNVSGLGAVLTPSTVVLAADVVNSNATANTIATVTGLSFPVTVAGTYYFRAVVAYTAAATSTGSRWSVTGPTASAIRYRSSYSLTTTTETVNSGLTAYDTPSSSNATSASTGSNIAVIEGQIVATAAGTVSVRFASSVASSAITAKAGSTLTWQKVA